MKYRLVRVLGRVLGLDWSQANVNVFTRVPPWTQQDLNGLSIMHAVDETGCVPITLCFPNPDQPKMDDRGAISRLYPVTTQNQSQFPGKQLFLENTIRIHGAVQFVDGRGLSAQGMQGVNVVARWIGPSTGQPSRSSVAASVSGFLFCGNAGNAIDGYNDDSGQAFNRFGSADPAVEGFFDLAGLEIPNGTGSAQYQLSVEALDPQWSYGVGPYSSWQVQPSGTAQPILLTASIGGDIQQDLLMQSSAQSAQDWFEPADYSAPAPLPSSGEWIASFNGYGNEDFFWFNAQTNRTLSVEVTALDESGAVTESKSLPVAGIWALSDPPGVPAPAATPMAFNSLNFGETRLDAQLLGTTTFRLGIADYRGDGRPDFRYHARVLYGDSILPSRASAAGGTPLVINGLGFHPGNTVTAGTTGASVLGQSPNQLMLAAPAQLDGVYDTVVADPITGGMSAMTGVLTFGAGPNDIINLVLGGNPPTPVGGQATNPVRVQVLASDAITPVAGASVVLSAVPAVAFSSCGGTSTCTVYSDDSGDISTNVTVLSAQVSTITATLAPASYNPAKLVQTTLIGTSSALDLALVSPYVYIAQGATLDVPLVGRVLSNGKPLSGRSVTFTIVSGSGTLTFGTVNTDASGYATSTLHVSAISAAVQVSVCVQPGSQPCQPFYLTVTPASALQLEPVSGSLQVIASGQSFHPVTVRATDNATPANPVLGASVVFNSLVSRLQANSTTRQVGDTIITRDPVPVILSSTQSTVLSDRNGLSALQPLGGGLGIMIQGTSTVGTSSLPFQLEVLEGVGSGGSSRAGKNRKGRVAARSAE